MKNVLLLLGLLAIMPPALAQIPAGSFAITSSGPAAERNPSLLRSIRPNGTLDAGQPLAAGDGTTIFDALGYNPANPGSLYAMNAILVSPTLFNPIPSPNFYQIDLESGLTRNVGEIEPPENFSLNFLTGRGTVGLTLNFLGAGGDNANYFIAGLVLDIRVNVVAGELRSVSNPRLFVGEVRFNPNGTPRDPIWRRADTSDPATNAIVNGYVTAINANPSSPDVAGGPRDWVLVRENGAPVLKSYLGVEGQLLTVTNITTNPVVRVTTPSVALPVRAELGAMFAGENNTLYAINTDGGPNAGQMYQVDAATGNYLNVTLNTGIGLFRGDAASPISRPPLPVTLTSFTARAERASVALRWATATEQGTDLFRVERSTDGGQIWAALGEVKAANAPQGRTYAFVDEAPQTGANAYRLLILDFDGSRAYSPVQSLDFRAAQASATLYPNPAQDQFAVELPELAAPGSSLLVLNSLGQPIWTQELNGQRTVRVSTQTWAAGVYYVRIFTGGQTKTQKLVIQR